MLRVYAALFALALGSCSFGSGVDIGAKELKGIYKGKTTYGDVLKKFGRPQNETVSANGRKTLSYSFVEYKMLYYIYGMRVNSATFVFNRRNILVDYSYSRSSSHPNNKS